MMPPLLLALRKCYHGVRHIFLTRMILLPVALAFSPAQPQSRLYHVLKSADRQRGGIGGSGERPCPSCAFLMMTKRHQQDADDLTREELILRISEVQDHYRQTKAISEHDLSLSLLRTRFPNLRLNRCFVGPSSLPNAGKGLFACRDIMEGELVTLYPGDALLIWNETVGQFGETGVGVMFGNHVQVQDRDGRRVSSNQARDFELKIGPTCSLVADPCLISDAAYIGHMANDAAILTQKDTWARGLYSKTTVDRHNAAFFDIEGSHYMAVATRQIEKNEEIFLSYGESYWMSRLYSTLNEAAAVSPLQTAVAAKANRRGNNKKSNSFGRKSNSQTIGGNKKKENSNSKTKPVATRKGGFGK